MGRDFGDDVLPNSDGTFMETSTYDAAATFTWNDVLYKMNMMLRDVKDFKLPEYGFGYGQGGRNACVLYLPKSSPMSRRWTADMRSQRTILGTLSGDILRPIKNATGIPIDGTYSEQS